MPRFIDADALRQRMYHEAFETDTEMQRWDSGCWIRYKLFENCLESMPTISLDEARGVGMWISVEERLPKKDEMVIVYYSWIGQSGTEYKEVSLATLEEMRYCGNKLLGWMPLPEPPKEVQDG